MPGKLQILSHFRSRILPIPRKIRVHLPPGYDGRRRKRYPVLYMQDGQNLFQNETAFGGVAWAAGETADRLIAAEAIEPLIIVGVDNTGEKRISEYTPTRHPSHKESGRAVRYGRLLLDELKPVIDARYRTVTGSEGCAIGGSSLGGLVSLHLALRYPGVFTKAAILSPSAWWDERAIVRQVRDLRSKPVLRIWLDIGAEEGQEAVAGARMLCEALVSRGWRLGEDLFYAEIPGAGHNEAAWGARTEAVLRFLFPRR